MVKRVLTILIISLVFLSSLYGQRIGPAYYEDRQKIVKYIPPIGTMFLYGGKLFCQYYDEPTISPDLETRVYPYVYYGYESLGLYVQFMTRYMDHDFYEIKGNSKNNDEENFGYDNRLIPNIIPKGRLYLLNYFILQRNLSYYFGDFLKTIRIGKLWINYSPYTIYRTFGPEGIAWEGSILPVQYEMFYSYNKIAGTNAKTGFSQTNTRQMMGAKFLYDNPRLFLAELIGSHYYAEGLRTEKIDSIRIGKTGIFDIIYLEFLNVERYHIEGDTPYGFSKTLFTSDIPPAYTPFTKYFFGRYSHILTDVNLKIVYLTFIYRETTSDFFPYDELTWMRYEPLQSETYDWIYETERAVKVNEQSYQLNLSYNIAGFKFKNTFDWSQYLDNDSIKPWMQSPELLFQLEVQYLINWVNVTHKLIQNTLTSDRLQNYYTELWIPITGSLSVIPHWEYYRKKRSNNVMTDKLVQFLQILFQKGTMKFMYEMKYSDINMNEPNWLTAHPYYKDQTWGIDNFIRFRFEYDF